MEVKQNSEQRTGKDLINFFQNSPICGVYIDLGRHKSTSRTVIFDAAITEGEADIKAGRVEPYSPAVIDRLTAQVLANQ